MSQRLYIEKLAELFLCADDSHCMFYPTTPMELNVFDRLEKAIDKPKFDGPYRSIVGGLLYLSVVHELIFVLLSLFSHNSCQTQSHLIFLWPNKCYFICNKRNLLV